MRRLALAATLTGARGFVLPSLPGALAAPSAVLPFPRGGGALARRVLAASMATDGSFDASSYMTKERDDATKDYVMQQVMVRVKDPKASLDFYWWV